MLSNIKENKIKESLLDFGDYPAENLVDFYKITPLSAEGISFDDFIYYIEENEDEEILKLLAKDNSTIGAGVKIGTLYLDM